MARPTSCSPDRRPQPIRAAWSWTTISWRHLHQDRRRDRCGNYNLTLYSRADGWRASADRLLDATATASAGDNYSRAFSLSTSDGAILASQSAHRPGQNLVGYASGNNVAPLDGLPIILSNAAASPAPASS